MSNIPAALDRIVVGVDGSAESALALRWGARIAAAEGTGITVVAAWEYPATYEWAAWPEGYSPETDMEKAAQDVVDAVFGAQRPADLEVLVYEGHPVSVLLKASKGARMLVVGSRGHGGFVGLLLGSVSARVAEHATCPVLVVHGDTAGEQARQPAV